MKIQAFIFDLDGTLGNTLPLCIVSFQQAFEEVVGIKYTEEEIVRHFGKTEEGITQNIAPDRWKECLNTYLEIYEKNHHLYPTAFDGISDILEYLKSRNNKIALVTGKGMLSAEITLKYFGIKDYFDYVEAGSPQGSIKPEGIEKIISRWGISKNNVVYVGDSPNDIIDSREAGIRCIAVTWAPTTDTGPLIALNPDFIFDKTEDFKRWLTLLS